MFMKNFIILFLKKSFIGKCGYFQNFSKHVEMDEIDTKRYYINW